MSTRLRVKSRLAVALLRASGLPSLGPVVTDAPSEQRLAAAADELLASGEPPRAIPVLTVLRWLAERRGHLFHGSGRADLDVLEPIRLTRDSTPFGDQQAVFAASDPVWAIYFATLRRDKGFRSTRNGSIGLPDALYPRWYFFSHNEGADPERRFGGGWLYVLPRTGFEREPPLLGILDGGQWASMAAVTPLVRIPVTGGDFPFAGRVYPHRLGERPFTTYVRATRLGRFLR